MNVENLVNNVFEAVNTLPIGIMFIPESVGVFMVVGVEEDHVIWKPEQALVLLVSQGLAWW